MVNEKMYELGSKKSTIRTIFEYGQKRAKEVGAENICDFSLGNPNVRRRTISRMRSSTS